MKSAKICFTLFLTIVLTLFISGCDRFPTETYPFLQKRANVEAVEICRNDDRTGFRETIVTLTGSETDLLWYTMSQTYCFNDKSLFMPSEYGNIVIKIRYKDGCLEIIGSNMTTWTSSSGITAVTNYRFYGGDFVGVIENFVSNDVIAEFYG